MKTKTLEKIATENTNFKTLATRNSDELDFKEVSVWQMKAALEAAFEAGKKAAIAESAHADKA